MREIPFGKPLIGEAEKKAVCEVLSGDVLVHGPKAKSFEADFAAFTKAPHAVSLSSCTAGLHLSYFNLGIGPGDEVIVPAQTHVATAHAVELCGAKPVFVDAEIRTGNMDMDRIEEKITERTKALSVVHFLGMPVDMGRVKALARKYHLFVVEDCALAIGTFLDGIHAGLHGDVGCFSFYPVKHLTTAEGGMLITRDEKIASRVERLKAFGVDRHPGERKIPGVYDVTLLGLNYRMNELEAALGIEQLKKVVLFLKARKENYETLSRGLLELDEIRQFETSRGRFQSSYYCLSILLSEKWADRRFEIVGDLKEKGIGTSIYYPKAVPEMSYYKQKYGMDDGQYPVARKISQNSIALPVGPHLNQDDMKTIVTCLKAVLRKYR